MNNTIKPKRRRYKDNPYSLLYEGEYEIIIATNNVSKKIKVSKEIYEEFNKFELDDLKQMNEFDRNITHYDLDEDSIYNLSINKEISIEENFIEQEINNELHNAINKLTNIQKERIIKYYFKNMKLEEIVNEEGTSFQAVSKSINKSIKKLKEILKNKV